MILMINGEKSEYPEGLTVIQLLEQLRLTPGATVVEHNGIILDRGQYSSLGLKEGDRLELVRFVGGG